MFLKQKSTGDLIEVLVLEDLFDPGKAEVSGRIQAGQEEQNAEDFAKSELVFPSDETLPRCWMDADYREA